MKEALMHSRKQRAAHNAMSATFDTDTIQQWTEMVFQWQQDLDKPNPFEEADVSTYDFYFLQFTSNYAPQR